MENNRPRGREKHVTGPAKKVQKQGEGLGTGPVGEAGGYSDRKQGAPPAPGAPGPGGRRREADRPAAGAPAGRRRRADRPAGGQPGGQSPSANQPGTNWAQVLGGLGGGSVSSGWQSEANTGKLNTSVAPGAREKYTRLLGEGKDTVTIMVYMCGTDLESRSSMGTYDLQEMLAAKFGKNVNLLVYTGGARAGRTRR